MDGKLYIIPTPIGNLEDITLRALNLLKTVDYVLAEDTRTSRKLFKAYEISTPIKSYHMHNEHGIVQKIVAGLLTGDKVALISDAGTPGISDPGYLIIREALTNHINVECLPGATALIPALVQSGIPCDRFVFYGFLPQKKGRKTAIENIGNEDKTVVLYESPHRMAKLVDQLITLIGDRPFSYSREITKMHHETFNGSLLEAKEHLATHLIKGEYVVVIGTAK